jgi:hypothetical protein
MHRHKGDQTVSKYALNYCVGDKAFGDLDWSNIEPGKLMRANTQVGAYDIELQPDGKTLRLSFKSESESRICPTKFQAINRAQWEADDHHRRLLALRTPLRIKPPKW